ncbi:MAG TPA: hypothetical protein VMM55_04575 [Thermohalobaculum sp.]|nr:hypothetical protein [Thermohalobaculum sp.]
MKRIACLPLALLSAVPTGSAAAPRFKTAPGTEQTDEGGGWSDYVPIDTEAAPAWMQGSLEFLAGNYGYMGVVAVLLMLFLFARGSGGSEKAARAGSGGDDDFFEPEDTRNYRGGPR